MEYKLKLEGTFCEEEKKAIDLFFNNKNFSNKSIESFERNRNVIIIIKNEDFIFFRDK